MSDEVGPSRTQRPSLGNDTLQQHDDTTENDVTTDTEQYGISARDAKLREEFKRLKLLNDLENQLDSLILIELAISYYMDCSFLRLMLRGLTQFYYLTPLPLIFPEQPKRQPYISAIIASNIVCMIFHLWNPNPSANDALRGYLHGGLAMDFIGTKGPVSKIHLILLDVFILGLQLVLLSANVKRRVLKERLKQPASSRTSEQAEAAPATATTTTSTATSGTAAGATAAASAGTNPSSSQTANLNPSQDIDAEEQGLLRRSMSIGSAYGTQTTNAESRRVGRDDHSGTPPNALLDALSSGQVVIAELRIAETVRDQFRLYQNSYSPAAPSDIAAQLAGRSLSLTSRFRLTPG